MSAVAAAILLVVWWIVLSVPLGILVGRWLRGAAKPF